MYACIYLSEPLETSTDRPIRWRETITLYQQSYIGRMKGVQVNTPIWQQRINSKWRHTLSLIESDAIELLRKFIIERIHQTDCHDSRKKNNKYVNGGFSDGEFIQ